MSQASVCLSTLAWTGNSRHANWNEIATSLSVLRTKVTTIEMVGRGAVDSIHSDSLVDVFVILVDEIEAEVERIEELVGLKEPVRKEVSV